jgi:TP53 regulating kinase-like protein
MTINLANFELFKQGAEAKLYLGEYLGQRAVIKERFAKKYRLPELDVRLTRERLRAEARSLVKCKTLGIKTPILYHVDQSCIVMEYLEFPTAKDYIKTILDDGKTKIPNAEQTKILTDLAMKIGAMIGKLHKNNLIHGDMTTSNMLVDTNKNQDQIQIYVIDFGLGDFSGTPEDKGVDLYVLERALISAHPNTEFMFEAILKSYAEELENNKMRQAVLKKYEDVRMRGRKRDMVG